jgi:GNAT superfamily N-acetyltransferase
VTEIGVRPLGPEDDRSGFVSGDEDLDRFFRKYAGQNQFKHHLGVTYVATVGTTIHGFLTVSASSIEIAHLARKSRRGLPRYPLPVLRMARLATALEARSHGIGKLLLRSAFELARGMAAEFGCTGVVVDAKPEAVAFYARYGFEGIKVLEGGSNARPMPSLMFLPLASIPGRTGAGGGG